MSTVNPSFSNTPFSDTPSSGLQSCDVLVIGGGPAGCTVAPLLAQKGYRVVVVEKAQHPRFHIGESLLPSNLPLLERLGVADEIRAIGVEKWSAEFFSPWHTQSQAFHFAEAWDKSMPYAYQVLRSEFDHILAKNAVKQGVTLLEGYKVNKVDFLANDSGAIVSAQSVAENMGEAGNSQSRQQSIQWHARFVVDASGRDTFLANRFKIKQHNPKHNSAAIYGHFANVPRGEGRAAGNIAIYWFDHGWFWFIPLQNGTTSIGMVTWPYFLKTRGTRSLQTFLRDGIALCAPLAERLKNATLINEVEAAGNYAYTASRCYGKNYVMLGDAYAFIDPVFSSGVLLAMNSGFMAADVVDTCLSQPQKANAALKQFSRAMAHGPKAFSWFIYRVTTPTLRDMFMSPTNIFRVQEALLSMLAGDIFGKTPIWRSIRILKLFYYMGAISQPKRTWMAWRKHRRTARTAPTAQVN